VGSVQHVFHHVVIKIRQLFLRPAACLTSILLETGVGANDCKCLDLFPHLLPAASVKLETTEPRPATECPENEEYKFCEPCNKTCDQPNPICPAQCGRGCFCVQDLVRDKDGRCVKLEQCSNKSLNEIRKFYIQTTQALSPKG
jgi:hypothetical protein